MSINIKRDVNKIEMLRKQYPEGTLVCLENMEKEYQMKPGLKGKVVYVDDIGQIHVKWENGSSLALIPGIDSFHKAEEKIKKKEAHEPQR